MRWRLLTTKLQRKMNRNIKNKTMNEGHSEPSHKADVSRSSILKTAKLKYMEKVGENHESEALKNAKKRISERKK